jgi:hypothetical protein
MDNFQTTVFLIHTGHRTSIFQRRPPRNPMERPMATSAAIFDEPVDQIPARERLYRSCFTADLDRLCAVHSTNTVVDALQRIERNTHRDADTWDQSGHAVDVRWVATATIGWHQ